MRKREAYMQEVERPLKHKLMAAALSLLMLMNMAPEYGFGLSVRARADETAPEANILITSDVIGGWLASEESPTAALLPGGDREFGADVAKEAFMSLFNNRPFVHEENLNDRGIFYIAAEPDGETTRGDIFYYNREGAPDVGIFLGEGYSVAEDEMVVYEPVISETAPDQTQINAVLEAEEPTTEEPTTEEPEMGPVDGATEENSGTPEPPEENNSAGLDDETAAPPEGNEIIQPGADEEEVKTPAAQAPAEDEKKEEATETVESDTTENPNETAEDTGGTDSHANVENDPNGGSESYVESTQVEGAYVVRSDVLSGYVEGEEGGQDAPQPTTDGETPAGTPTQTFAIEYQINSGAHVNVKTYPVTGGTSVSLSGVPEGQLVKLPFYGTSADNLAEVIAQWREKEKPILRVQLNGQGSSAGVEIPVSVAYLMPSPPLYTNGVTAKAHAFEKYEDVTVRLTLTPGLTVTGATGAELTGDAEQGFTLTYKGDGSWNPVDFNFNVKTVNDGSAVGKTFGIESASIVGKVGEMTDNVNGAVIEAFEQSLALEGEALPSFVPEGNETWSISHKLTKTEVSKENGKVTLEYVIGAGLAGDQGPVGVGGRYDVAGRLGFEDGSFTITEELPTFEDIGGKKIAPLSSKMEFLGADQSAGTVGSTETVTGGAGDTTLQMKAYSVGPKKQDGHYNFLSTEMPFYTEYKVTATYSYEDFVVPFEQYESLKGDNKYILTANAQLNYTPKGQTAVTAGPVEATTSILESGGKGGLTIEKYIQIGKGDTAMQLPYDYRTAQTYEGGASFRIVPKDGARLPAGMHIENGAAAVTLTPTEQAPENRLNIPLSPGKYEIFEANPPEDVTTISPDGTDYSSTPITVTVMEDKEATAVFTDMSVGRGAVQFVKTDEWGNKLKGVKFTITGPKNAASPATQEAESDVNGKVYFQGLKPGEYTIKETQALAGYAPWQEDVEVTVKADEIVTPENVPVNVNVSQDLIVNLQIRQLNGQIRQPQTDENNRFTALIWPSTGSKETAVRVQLTGEKTTVKGLPAYTVENGKATPIQYYISEDLTQEATYDLVDAANGASIESIVVPVYENGKTWETTVTNGYTGSVRLVKSLAWYDQGGEAPENPRFQFQLFDVSKAQAVSFKASTGNGGLVDRATVAAGNNQGLTASGLGAGSYFWKEVFPEESAAEYDVFYSTDNRDWTAATDGFIPAGEANLAAPTVYVRNVPKKVRLVIEKQDEAGNALSGAEFQLKQGETVVKDKLDGSGNLFWADVVPGTTYTLVETKAPDNYVKAVDKEIKVEAPKTGEATVQRVTVENRPNPTLTVKKTVTGVAGKDLADGQVVFKVYSGDASGPSGDPLGQIAVTLKDGVQTKAGSLKLPQRDQNGKLIHYWLTEESVPMYKTFQGYNTGAPVLLKQDKIDAGTLPETGSKTVEVSNPLNFATVEIEKTDGENRLPGARILVSGGISGGQQLVGDSTSKSDGPLSFVLPVYKSDQTTPIEYTTSEHAAPAGYIKTDHSFKFMFSSVGMTLKTGQEYAGGEPVGNANAPLTFVNTPYITITATKTVTGWGDGLNGTNVAARTLKGVALGLYEETDGGSYKLVDTGTTDELGSVTFGGADKKLAANKKYRVYELYDPNGYAPSAEGKRAVLESMDEEVPATIAANSDFYYSDVKADGTAGKNGLFVTATLTNQESWVQFKGTKVSSQKSEAGETVPLNLARFQLYKAALPESGEVAYDPENRGTLYKTYTSGYTAGRENLREPGVFYTDVLEPGYLYWLVETDVPPGYDPEKTVVFGLVPESSGISIKDNNHDDGVTVKQFGYKGGLNDLKNIENDPKSGAGGDGTVYAYTALILDKVLGSEEAKLEDCIDVADVTFELWLLDGTQRIKLVDTLVTGKDATDSKTGIGRAFSQPINLQQLYEEVHEAHPQAVNKTSGEGDNATYQATLELVETKMPAGMKLDGRAYKVTIDTAEALNAAKAENGIPNFNSGRKDKQIVQGNEGYVLLDMTYTRDSGNPVKNVPASGSTIFIKKYGYVPKDDGELKATDAELAQKKDSLNGLTPLQGVKFEIRNVNSNGNNSFKGVVTTDANGVAWLPEGKQLELPNGYYTLKETVSHPDYANRNMPIAFTVQSGSQTIEVFNPKTPLVRIVKNDGNVRDGITFKLGDIQFDAPGQGSNEWTKKIPAGEYTLTEEVTGKATTGAYFGSDVRVQVKADGTVTVTGNGPVTAVGNLIKVHNPKTGSLTIKKVDGATNAQINSEASFEVKYLPFNVSYQNGQTVLTQGEKPAAADVGWRNVETSEKVTGKKTLDNLAPGWYMVTEKAAPEGYEINTEPQIAAVMPEPAEAAEVAVKDTAHGKLTLSKTFDYLGVVGAEQAQYPKNVTFMVTPATPEITVPPVTVSIGNDGKGALRAPVRLPAGTYTVTETVPQGWRIAEAMVTNAAGSTAAAEQPESFEIVVESGKTTSAAVKNVTTAASVTVKKVDSADASIADVEFTLTGQDYSAQAVTGQDGRATFIVPNPQGMYTLKETKAPPEFVVPAGNGVSLQLEPGKAYNEATTSELKITNTRGVVINATKYEGTPGHSGTTMNNVPLILEKMAEGEWQTVSTVTTKNGGKAVFGNLTEGEYAIHEGDLKGTGFENHMLAGVTVGDRTAPEDAGSPGRYLLGTLDSGQNEVSVFNRKPQTLTITKQELGKENINTQTATAAYEIYAVNAEKEPGAERPEGAELVMTVRESHVARVQLQPGVYYVLETGSSSLQLDNTDPRTPTSRCVTIVEGQDASLTFVNAPKASSLKPAIEKKAIDPMPAGNPLYGDQTASFQLDGFAKGDNVISLDSVTVNDEGLSFFARENGKSRLGGNTPDYRIDKIAVGGASYDVIGSDGTAASSSEVQATLYVDGAEQSTKIVPAEFEVNKGKEFSLKYTAKDGKLGPHFKAEPVKVEMTVLKQAGTTGETAMTRSAVNTAGAVYTVGGADMASGKVAACVNFPADNELPPMDIEKASVSNNDTVEIGGTITYTLTLSNQSADKNIEKPVIIDLLPRGVEMQRFEDGSLFTVGDGQPKPQCFVESDVNGRQYVLFEYGDPLKAGATFTITYQVLVQPTIMNGSSNPTAHNQAWATSLNILPTHTGNLYGMSFRSVEGNLVYAAGNDDLKFVDATLKGTFGYVYSNTQNGIQNASSMQRFKEVTTTTENGKYYQNQTSAKAQLNDTITYRLTVINGSKKTASRIRVVDSLPVNSDSRSSAWSPEYAGNVKATIGGKSINVDVTGSSEAYTDAEAKALSAGTEKLSAADKNTKTLLLDFGDEELRPNETLQITFDAMASESAPEQLYKAATNTFWVYYKNSLAPLVSNPASVVLVPDSVAVGGKIWIDENGNGILDGTEANNKDWKDVLGGLTLVEHGQMDRRYDPTVREDGSFFQEKLTAAKGNGGVLYEGDNLLRDGLMGNPPTTYKLQAVPAEGFGLTTAYGGNNFLKRSLPAQDLNSRENGKVVSHFNNEGTMWTSEEFFLWPADSGTDEFKNLGLTRTRNLTVNKTEKGTGAKLDGAKFALYGPFDDAASVTAETLENMQPVQTGTTGNGGTLAFQDLMYYQAYVVKEVEAAPNYALSNAQAAGFTKLDGAEAWIVQKGDQGRTTVSGDVTLNVENSRQQAGLTIRKVMADGSGALPEDVFTFQIMVDGKLHKVGASQAEGNGVTVTQDGKLQFHVNEMATVTGLPAGSTYEIVETLPENSGYASTPVISYESGNTILADAAGDTIQNHVTVTNQNNSNGEVPLGGRKELTGRTLGDGQFQFQLVDKVSGTVLETVSNTGSDFRFKPIVYTRADIGKTFTYLIKEVIPAEADRKGVAYDATVYEVTVTVKAGGETGVTTEVTGDQGIVFRNAYGAAGEITLGALKRTVGATLEKDQFSFKLKDTQTGREWTAENGADGSVKFPAISYTETGEHDYTIWEVRGSDYGYTFDDKTYNVHVTVSDPEGNGVLHAEATMDGKPFDSNNAVFVNRFSSLSLDLYKYRDGNTNRYLNGAEFALYKYDENAAYNRGVLVDSGTTASGGRLRFENLAAGQYVLVETYVPSRYEALESQYVVKLGYDGNNDKVVELVTGGRHASVRDDTLYVPNRYRGGSGGGDDDDDGDDGGGGRDYGRDDDTGRDDGGDGGTQPLTQIPEPAVPLSDAPNPLTQIPDEDVPLGALPNTGGFPVGAFAVIGGLLALLGIKIKKRKHAE